jgi:chaperonin GroES
MRTKLRPLGEKVLVKRAEAKEKTESGIFLPQSVKEKPQEATVVAIGDGKLLDNGQRSAFQVKVGDRVLISKWGGTELKMDNEEMLIMDESDILGVVD